MQFSDNTLLNLSNISYKIEDKVILQNIDIEVKKGQILTIIGPNGSGKTSLAKLVASIIKPTTGHIFKKNGLNIGYMPQKIFFDSIFPLNSLYFLKLCKTDTSNLQEIIDMLELKNIITKQVHNLSGGEMQKLLFARSLLGKPDLLILDEPTKAMDVRATANFYKIIEEIRQKKQISSLIISHDLYMVMKTTDHVFCLNGHICCHGKPEDVANSPSYHNLFGSNSLENISIYQHQHDHIHK